MSASWEQTTLGEVVSFKGGGTPSTEKSSYWNGDIPWVSPKDMKSSEVGDSIDKITPEAIENSAASLIPKGAILIVVRSGILARTIPVGITTRPLAVNQDIKALCPYSGVDPRYLHYFMQASEPNILKLVTRGATVHRLSTDNLKALEFPKPPLPEQQRIVAVLDEALAGLATASANAKKNLESARELFQAQLNSVFETTDEDWRRLCIKDLCATIVDCPNRTAPKIDGPSPYKMIRTTNVRNGRVDIENVNFVSEEVYHRWTRRQVPQRGDVLLTREAPLGEVGMLCTDDKVFLGQRLVSYRVDPKELDNHFLLFALQSKDLQQQIRAFGSGATVQHMRVPDSKALMINVPPLAKQKRISSDLNDLLNASDALVANYESKLQALGRLKQSALTAAFGGQLGSLAANQICEAAE